MARKIAIVAAFLLMTSGLVLARDRQGGRRTNSAVGTGVVLQRNFYYPFAAYVVPYQAPVLLISPYGTAYYLLPAVVVSSPYFCTLHNDAFVSRIGLLDHLAGMHKISLDAAASICPVGVSSCIFPQY